MEIAEGVRYHKEHEWIRIEGKQATLGISDFAQEALGDIVYVELPSIGTLVQRGGVITEVESTKAASPVYAPVGGTIIAVNETLKEKPEFINKKPYTEGWLAVIEMSHPEEAEQLMDPRAYAEFLKQQGS